MALILRSDQKESLDFVTVHERALVLSEQGVGKTIVLLMHLRNLLLAGEVKTALIVATASGINAWTRDIKKFSPSDQKMLTDAITLVGYAKISRKDSAWRERIHHWWDVIILDESHALKKPTSNRCQYFIGKGKALGLTSKCRFLYQLTGTLITNSHLEDAWAPLRAILGDEWAYYRYEDFERHFLITTYLPGSYVKMIRGYRHTDELLALLAHYSYRVLAADVLTDKPDALPDEVVVVSFPSTFNDKPFHKTSQQLYDDALDSYVEALDRVTDNPLTRMGLLRQIAAGHIKEPDTRDEHGKKHRGETHYIATNKIDETVRLIAEHLPEKTVVFHEFVATGLALEAALRREGIGYHALNGAQKDKGVWKTFQRDDTPVFIGQYASSSRSIDLFAAYQVVFMEPTDSSEVLEQARKRADRHGQTRAVRNVFLLTDGTIECDMYATLMGHEDFHEKTYREIARERARGVTA
jgi:SNF2 family DNA or RNA helicase